MLNNYSFHNHFFWGLLKKLSFILVALQHQRFPLVFGEGIMKRDEKEIRTPVEKKYVDRDTALNVPQHLGREQPHENRWPKSSVWSRTASHSIHKPIKILLTISTLIPLLPHPNLNHTFLCFLKGCDYFLSTQFPYLLQMPFVVKKVMFKM